jgi:hypothetical protein
MRGRPGRRRRPFRQRRDEGRIDRDDVGFLADLERSGDVVEAERPGAVERAESQPVERPEDGSRLGAGHLPRVLRVEPDAHDREDRQVGAGRHVRAETDRQPGFEIATERHHPGGKEQIGDRTMCDSCASRHQAGELTIRQVDRMGEHGSRPEPAGAVVDIDVVERGREEPHHFRDLAAILGQVRLPPGAGRAGERCRFAQQLGGARDGEPRCHGIAQTAAGGAVPALDEARRFGQAPVEDGRRIDGRVVGDPIHHDLAHDRPDAVLLGGPERCIEAGLVHGPVNHGRRRPGGGEGAPGRRRDDLGRGDVEAALEREDVSLEPGKEIHPRPKPRVRELRQVSMEVDHARQDHPRTEIDGPGKSFRRRPVGRSGIGQAPVCIDDQQAVALVAGPAVIERRQQARPHRKRRSIRELANSHAGEASTWNVANLATGAWREVARGRQRARASTHGCVAHLGSGPAAPRAAEGARSRGERTPGA